MDLTSLCHAAQRDVFCDRPPRPTPEAEPERHHHGESADASSPIVGDVLSLSLGGDPSPVPEAALVTTTPPSKFAKMGDNCWQYFSANPPEEDLWGFGQPNPLAASSSQCHYELLVLSALTFVSFYTLPFVKAAIAVSVFSLLCISLPQRVVVLIDQIGENKLKSLPLAVVLIVVFSAGFLVGLLV